MSWIKSASSPQIAPNSLSSTYQRCIQCGREITVPLLNVPCGESHCTSRGYGCARPDSMSPSFWQTPKRISLHGGQPPVPLASPLLHWPAPCSTVLYRSSLLRGPCAVNCQLRVPLQNVLIGVVGSGLLTDQHDSAWHVDGPWPV